MGFSTLQDWVGAWKELKQWCLHKAQGIPDGIKEAGVWYDSQAQRPMWYDGTKARMFGIVNHNELDEIDGGDATFRGHITNVQAGYLDNAGAANGVALLDSNGYLPIDNIPASLLGAVRYQGTWNPATNTPALVTPPSASTKGFYYVSSAVGTWDGKTFAVGDWIISNGTAWERVDNVDAISSVFGRTGAVTAQSGDYTATQITSTATGDVSATTVQGAIAELASEKLAASTAANTYAPISATLADNAASSTLPTARAATSIVALLQQVRDYLRYLLAGFSNGLVTKLGTATVGSTSKPVYLNAGTPTALSATVGSASVPTYYNAGQPTACTSLSLATTGNAATATKLATARTITVDSSDMTAPAVSFDGSANITLAPTLDATGVTAGTYTKVTVDAKGRVTAGASASASDVGLGNVTNPSAYTTIADGFQSSTTRRFVCQAYYLASATHEWGTCIVEVLSKGGTSIAGTWTARLELSWKGSSGTNTFNAEILDNGGAPEGSFCFNAINPNGTMLIVLGVDAQAYATVSARILQANYSAGSTFYLLESTNYDRGATILHTPWPSVITANATLPAGAPIGKSVFVEDIGGAGITITAPSGEAIACNATTNLSSINVSGYSGVWFVKSRSNRWTADRSL